MASSEQIKIWKGQIAIYKEIYTGRYPGKQASDKLIGSFCKINGIPWPLPDIDEDFEFLK